MFNELFHSDTYSLWAMIFYYLGAVAWLATYVMIIRRMFKDKFVEFPVIVVTGNVVWEILGGFVIYPPLPFGGNILMWGWRLGAILDIIMLYGIFKYGAKQWRSPQLVKYHHWIVVFTFLAIGAMTYTYYQAGYDLPMMFNSGMILNVVMSVLCINLFIAKPDYRFSPYIAWSKFLASSVFFMIYLILATPDAYFAGVMGVICFILDIIYINMVTKRWRATSSS